MPFDFLEYRRHRGSGAIGTAVVYLEESGSTMDDARAGAVAGGAPGTAYVAGTQTAGRGRLGRAWQAPPRGLYVTFHLRPTDAATVPLYSVAGALAVSDAVRVVANRGTEVKWPNDLLAGGRKLAGILAESTIGDRIDVFLGIGVNVGAQQFPPEVAALATTIEDASGSAPSNEVLLAALSSALERHVSTLTSSPAALVDEWRSRLVTLGRRVRLAAVGGVVHEGEAVDVTSSGELVLRLDDGSRASFAAGDVTMA